MKWTDNLIKKELVISLKVWIVMKNRWFTNKIYHKKTEYLISL